MVSRIEANRPASVPIQTGVGGKAAPFGDIERQAAGAKRRHGGVDGHQTRQTTIVRPDTRASRQDQAANDRGDYRCEKAGEQCEIPRVYGTAYEQANKRADHSPDQHHNQSAG